MKNKGDIMSDKIVTLTTFVDLLQSELAKVKLEGEGIESFVSEDVTYTLYGHAMGAIKLLVKECDVERASEILKDDGQPI